MKPILSNLAIAAMSVGFVCLVGERALAQETGLIHACAKKDQLRMATSAGDCKPNERHLVLVSADAVADIYESLHALQDVDLQILKDRLDVLKNAQALQQAAQDNEVAARVEAIQKARDEAQQAWQAAMLVAIASGSASVSCNGVVSVSDLAAEMQKQEFLARIGNVRTFLACATDTDGDGVPDSFGSCPPPVPPSPTCGQCPVGKSCVPSDVGPCVCVDDRVET